MMTGGPEGRSPGCGLGSFFSPAPCGSPHPLPSPELFAVCLGGRLNFLAVQAGSDPRTPALLTSGRGALMSSGRPVVRSGLACSGWTESSRWFLLTRAGERARWVAGPSPSRRPPVWLAPEVLGCTPNFQSFISASLSLYSVSDI